MARRAASSWAERREALREARETASREVDRLRREEQFLLEQMERAEDQVRYYDRLLAKHRRDSGPPQRLPAILRRLG